MNKSLPAGRQGFTLIEILIVLVLFGVLMTVGTDMFLNVIQNSNLATMQNDVRQNAGNILRDVSANIRASYSVTTSPTVIISSASGTVTYALNSDNLTKNGAQLNSNSVVVPTFTVSCSPPVPPPPQTCTITIVVRQKSTTARWDQQASVTLIDTVTARSY